MMNVLIADFDLFAKVGGGQTFYRAVIEKNPQLNFSYLAIDEPADAPRPANARPVAYREYYRAEPWADFDDFTPPRWCLDAFLKASNIARSVAGRKFDVVDLPDYEQFGMFLRPALEHHGVRAATIALSLHGRLSTSVEMNWATEGQPQRPLVTAENMQYQTADLRYGISRAYLDEWAESFDFASYYFSPLRFIDLPRPTRTSRAGTQVAGTLRVPRLSTDARGPAPPPDLHFFGRTEKRKGPDLFIELAWWLPRESYGAARVIGPESRDPDGVGSVAPLSAMARHRQGEDAIEFLPAMNPAQLRQLFATRSITILPSRYDTFLLAATESLLSGCPTAIGSGAGVCRFLEETFPGVPFIKIDVDRPYACLGELQDILSDYDAYRDRLVDALLAAKPRIDGLGLADIYRQAPEFEEGVRRELQGWYERLMGFRVQGSHEGFRVQGSGFSDEETQTGVCRERTPCRSVRDEPTSSPDSRSATTGASHRTARVAEAVGDGQRNPGAPGESVPYGDHAQFEWKARVKRVARAVTTPGMRRTLRRLDPRPLFRHPTGAPVGPPGAPVDPLAARSRALHHLPERTGADLDRKLAVCAELVSELRIDRVRLWREIGRLEALRGNALLAASYRLRAMRLAGGDRWHDLPAVTATLCKHGYAREAEAAAAMYGPGGDEACGRLLDDALASHRSRGDAEYEFIDDRRDRAAYKASVIVSLYDAADKLPQFLAALRAQTMIGSGRAELVLIDSASPGDDYTHFRRLVADWPAAVVYARSKRRETIQAAWNRGIALCRGEYLSFLGVDEALRPPALETLARELDADPALDWVQANSLVTNVNRRGHWLNDIMVYDRTGYEQPLVYLESCYLAFVGSLYRRSVHDRFGYYDASYRGAGDTEFKNRVLPFIKTKVIPETLGIFWNYPSGQTTCSPLAELEDLRALYLHRTAAGVRYAFERRDPAEAEKLLCAALRYRKSYCRHWSTDVEYAQHLARFVAQRDPRGRAAALGDGIDRVLGVYRSLDLPPRDAKSGASRAGSHPADRLTDARRVADAVARQQARLTDERVQPVYEIFNDNRHEQHANVWRAA